MSPDSSSPPTVASNYVSTTTSTSGGVPSPFFGQQQHNSKLGCHMNTIQVQECTQSQDVAARGNVIITKAIQPPVGAAHHDTSKFYQQQQQKRGLGQQQSPTSAAYANGSSATSPNSNSKTVYVLGSGFGRSPATVVPNTNSYATVDTTTGCMSDNNSTTSSHKVHLQQSVPSPQQTKTMAANQPIYHHQQPQQKQHQVGTSLLSLKDDVELNIGNVLLHVLLLLLSCKSSSLSYWTAAVKCLKVRWKKKSVLIGKWFLCEFELFWNRNWKKKL